MLSDRQREELVVALAGAFGDARSARELFAKLDLSFEAIIDPSESNPIDRMRPAVRHVVDAWRLGELIAVAEARQPRNLVLKARLVPFRAAVRAAELEARWELLTADELFMPKGPFVNRRNLHHILDHELLTTRRLLRITGAQKARGKSWSRQLIERKAAFKHRC